MSLLLQLSQSEVLCEPFPLLRVALRATVPFLYAAGIFLHRTSLAEKASLILQYCTALEGLPVLVPKLGWLVLSPPMLVEGELRLYQRSSGVELARLPVLMFLLIEAQ
jgi:hypothetical protein